jgi:hypothetical protein
MLPAAAARREREQTNLQSLLPRGNNRDAGPIVGAKAPATFSFPARLASRAPARRSESGKHPCSASSESHAAFSRLALFGRSPLSLFLSLICDFCLSPFFLRPGFLPFLARFELMKSGVRGRDEEARAASGRRSRLFDLRKREEPPETLRRISYIVGECVV